MAQDYDYGELGLKCGLEIHQQLDSRSKLFCRCPNDLQGTRDPDFTVLRYMRPVLGEMGTYDEAMLTEYEKEMSIIYEGYNDVICTYELDETPPFDCNDEARRIAIKIARLLNANVVPEMHVCRKNYLDGSVPCGFQRTMILAKGGHFELENGKKIGIDILCLEEDACRKIETKEKTNIFRLDRLGIPLVEVTTKPDIRDPEECRVAAERLGLLLWSTNVKKVLGSIRQDVNVSIKEGTRIEIKGVQKLDWIPLLINHEISRQIGLLELKEELKERKITPEDVTEKIVDLSEEMSNTSSKFIAKGIKSGKKLYGINLKGFNGLLGKELMKDYRFGTELASKVKSISGLKGIIHSDENLEKYHFSDQDLDQLRASLESEEDDCFVLVLGSQAEVEKAMKVILGRIKHAFAGVPPETRKALESGNTEFLRELHGGARLYPDTDSQPVLNPDNEIKEIERELPELPWRTIKEYEEKYDIEPRMTKDLIFEGKLDLFNELITIYPDNPTLIITTLLETTTALRRDGKEVERISKKDYADMFKLLKNDEIGKEALEDIMIKKSEEPDLTIQEIKDELNIEKMSLDQLEQIVENVVDKNTALIKERKMGAMGPLMGELMAEVRGMIDGKIVSDKLKHAIQQSLKELK